MRALSNMTLPTDMLPNPIQMSLQVTIHHFPFSSTHPLLFHPAFFPFCLMSRLVVSLFPLYVVNSLQDGTILSFLILPLLCLEGSV